MLKELFDIVNKSKTVIALNDLQVKQTAIDLDKLSVSTTNAIEALDRRVNGWNRADTILATVLTSITGAFAFFGNK